MKLLIVLMIFAFGVYDHTGGGDEPNFPRLSLNLISEHFIALVLFLSEMERTRGHNSCENGTTVHTLQPPFNLVYLHSLSLFCLKYSLYCCVRIAGPQCEMQSWRNDRNCWVRLGIDHVVYPLNRRA